MIEQLSTFTSRLWTRPADGALTELLPRRRGIGGACAHADGGWVISGRTLLHLRPDGTQRELRSRSQGSTWQGS
jgi:hypothetical protein